MYRELAAANPDRYRPDLATSLDNLGGRLLRAGRPADALPATEEAVAIHRELAAARPGPLPPRPRPSLGSLGVRLSELGRPADALPVTRKPSPSAGNWPPPARTATAPTSPPR